MKTQDLKELFRAELEAQIKPVQTEIQFMRIELEKTSKCLYGNGDKGLVSEVQGIKNTQTNMLGKIGMISTFFGLVFAAMFEVITRFISHKFGIDQ